MKILVHTVPERMWYVSGYLVPQLLEQGADPGCIRITRDDARLGNLEATMRSFEKLAGVDGGTWHLQDDILLASNFVETAESFEGCDEIICGFAVDDFDAALYKTGHVPQCFLWLSFPCIYIPNRIAAGCAAYYRGSQGKSPDYQRLAALRKGDDSAFWAYVHNEHKHEWGWNLDPNLCEHVDHLLGGSLVNPTREAGKAHAKYFPEPEAVERLADRINNRIRARSL